MFIRLLFYHSVIATLVVPCNVFCHLFIVFFIHDLFIFYVLFVLRNLNLNSMLFLMEFLLNVFV